MTDDEFERFYTETSAPLHAYLFRAVGADSLAEDLVQSTYLRFLSAQSRPRDVRARRVYLFRIARSLLRDEIGRQAVERRRLQGLTGQSSEGQENASQDAGVGCETRIDVSRAFEALSERDRELLWLAYVLEMTHREIGVVVGVGETSVRVLLHRARGRFSSILSERGIGPEDLT